MQLGKLFITDLRIFQAKRLQHSDDDLGHTKAREPFMVGWDNEPWRPLAAGVMEHVFVCHHVLVPEFAFPNVGGGKLPVFFFLLDPFEEAHPLLLLRNAQKELQDKDAVVYQVALEAIDLFESPFPNRAVFFDRADALLLEGQDAPGQLRPPRNKTD